MWQKGIKASVYRSVGKKGWKAKQMFDMKATQACANLKVRDNYANTINWHRIMLDVSKITVLIVTKIK